ncbi:MAG TPA: M20/M25/M40 family metallo-hydrolase [Vicinamibacterales bacterium]|nr:M20/M25/M40 family metallo-hydrolase [Vicinamibacterales bacterium]
MREFPTVALALLLSLASLTAQTGPHDALARDIYKQLIEINTTDSVGSVTKAAEAMAQRLKAAGFPAADVQLLGPDPRKQNLVARYHGTGARKPLLLLAHLDVVEAKREDWSFDPFVFLEKDGFFYGRGTSDDKAMASIFTANVIRLKQEGFQPDRDLILALTADEEGGKFNGVDWLVKNHRNLIDAELAINEGGSGQMKGGKYLINEVGASEKVYQDFKLEVKNAGGHSSRPVRDNAIYHLSDALGRLERFDFPLNLNEVTRTYFDRMAAFQTNAKVAADMRAVAKQPPDPQAVARLAAGSAYYNALMRTTCVATMLAGGHATNALPQLATANVNCRILPGEAPAAIKQKLIDVVADRAVAVSFVDEAKPSPPSPLQPQIMQPLEAVTKAVFPSAIVVPTMGTGATDGLYLRNAGIPTYGIEGIFYEIDDNRAHGRDERVGVKQYFEGLEFQYRLIKALASQHP